jgi:hypothetical protein
LLARNTQFRAVNKRNFRERRGDNNESRPPPGENNAWKLAGRSMTVITMASEESKSHLEDRRFREVYRYFQPSNPAALLYSHVVPPPSDEAQTVHSSAAETLGASLAIGLPSQDSSSANTILTTFAQNATLKLNADRAIIRYVPSPCWDTAHDPCIDKLRFEASWTVRQSICLQRLHAAAACETLLRIYFPTHGSQWETMTDLVLV